MACAGEDGGLQFDDLPQAWPNLTHYPLRHSLSIQGIQVFELRRYDR